MNSNVYKDKVVLIKAIDKIFHSVHGLRTFQPFGFIAHKENPAPEKQELQHIYTEEFRYFWHDDISDWVENITGEALSKFEPKKADFERLKLVK